MHDSETPHIDQIHTDVNEISRLSGLLQVLGEEDLVDGLDAMDQSRLAAGLGAIGRVIEEKVGNIKCNADRLWERSRGGAQ